MHSPIRRLYLYHLLNSIATTVVASYLFLDQILLRLDLSMAQIGTVKGIGLWLPMTLNLIAAPYVMRMQKDHLIVAIGQAVRVVMPFGFLFVHHVSDDAGVRTFLCTALMVLSLTPLMLANNSAQALCMQFIPRPEIGKHMSRITALWNIPFLLLAIPCAWYIDRYAGGDDAAFYRAFFVLFLITGLFQLPSSWQIYKLSTIPDRVMIDRGMSIFALIEPFRNHRFRRLLSAILVVAIIVAMVMSFVYPFLIQALEMPIAQIGVLEAVVGVLGFAVMPLWGTLADWFGGRAVMRISAVGVALALFCMVGQTAFWVWVSALLAWKATLGIFGSGLSMGQQYLTLSLSDPHRRNIYLATATFVYGCGMLIGAVVGGYLLDWIQQRVDPELPFEHYRIYYLFCALAFLITGSFLGSLSDGRRRVGTNQLAMALFRRVRNFSGRVR